MQLRSRHWFAALGIAALTHAGLAWLFYVPSQPPVGARAMGLSGIEIALGPAGGAPGTAEAVTSSTEPADDTQRPDEVETVQENKFESVVDEKPERKTDTKPAPPPEQIPVAKTRPAAPVSAPQPELESETPAKPKAKTAAQALTDTPVPPQQPTIRGTDGKNGTKDRRESGDGDTGVGGGVPGTERDYLSLLSAWLERHKQYPSRAQRRRQEGTVQLRFVVDREGKVLSYQIENTSGYTLLDREVEKMIRRAAPLPAMPKEMAQSRLELVVPVSFYLR